MITDTSITAGDFGKSNSSSLKTAFGGHPNSISKDKPSAKFGDTSELILAADSTDLDNASYASFYAQNVMTGENSNYVDHFGEETTMDYSSAPDQGSLSPPEVGDPAPGTNGSTIAPSGLGPNVNVSDINDRAMVDAEPTPNSAFPGQTNARANPSVTSSKIANAGVKGSKVKGISAASILEVV